MFVFFISKYIVYSRLCLISTLGGSIPLVHLKLQHKKSFPKLVQSVVFPHWIENIEFLDNFNGQIFVELWTSGTVFGSATRTTLFM